MARNFRLEAERSGGSIADAETAFVSRAALGRMVTEEEVGRAVVAMLDMPGSVRRRRRPLRGDDRVTGRIAAGTRRGG